MAASSVQPERILNELSELWVSLGKQEGDATASGVLRACAMTLIVAVEDTADAASIGETIAELMHEHPSRAIVLKVRDAVERQLEARVFAQCWMPFGRRQQICCEQIEITASRASLGDVPALLHGLPAPDLPVVLWCRGGRLFTLPGFQAVLPLARKWIVDSAAFDDPGAVLADLARAVAARQRLADLAWARLTIWREAVAQTFENPLCRARIPEINQLRVRHAAASTPPEADYLLAWLCEALGREPRLEVASTPRRGDGEIQFVGIEAPGFQASIELVDGGAAEIRVDGLASRSLVRSRGEYDLLREELSIAGRDPIFERALARAVRLRESRRQKP